MEEKEKERKKKEKEKKKLWEKVILKNKKKN